MMEWIYVAAALLYVLVGILSVVAFEMDNALQVVALVFLWPLVCTAAFMWMVVKGLTSRR